MQAAVDQLRERDAVVLGDGGKPDGFADVVLAPCNAGPSSSSNQPVLADDVGDVLHR